MVPDLLLDGLSASGAAKFVFTKTPLDPRVGTMMASLMYYWRRWVADVANTDPGACVVYEPRLPWVHVAAKNPEKLVREAARACSVIEALWRVA
jgi:hypothetical protein